MLSSAARRTAVERGTMLPLHKERYPQDLHPSEVSPRSKPIRGHRSQRV